MGTKRVVVIGAGPSGSAAAMELAGLGVECHLLERKPLPRTKACGSGLSPWTLDLLDTMGVGPRVREHAYRIDGAILCGTNGDGVELRGDHETAILRRSELDYLLVQEAVRRGAKLHDDTRVDAIRTVGHRSGSVEVAVETSEGTWEADLVLDCSGSTGQLERKTTHHGYEQPNRKDSSFRTGAAAFLQRISERLKSERVVLHTIMGWYQGMAGCSDVVELFFDKELRPHYAWVFPETATRVNIGLCFLKRPDGPNARQHFEAFLDRRLSQRLRHAELLGKWIGHPVQVSALAQDLVAPGVLRAGEAGWLADAATAEGIYHALLSGRTAGRYAAEHLLSRRDASVEHLQVYQTRVQKALVARLALGRALMGALQTPTLDWALSMKSSAITQKALSRAFTGLYHG